MLIILMSRHYVSQDQNLSTGGACLLHRNACDVVARVDHPYLVPNHRGTILRPHSYIYTSVHLYVYSSRYQSCPFLVAIHIHSQDEDFLPLTFGLPLEPPGLPTDLSTLSSTLDAAVAQVAHTKGGRDAALDGEHARGLAARLRFRKTLFKVSGVYFVCMLYCLMSAFLFDEST